MARQYCRCHKPVSRFRSAMGTCGKQKCIQNLQKELLGGGDDNTQDPSQGAKVKVNGKTGTVKYSKTVRGTNCVVLKDGTTVPMDRVEWL